MSRFFYFGGYIIRGGYRIFSVPKRKATAPPAREGFCCEARFRAEQQKGWAGEALSHFSSSGNFPARIVGSEISHFRAMISLLFVYLVREKFLKWYQIRLEEGFWTLQAIVRLLGLPHFIFCISWNFISKSRISFLKTDRGAGFEVSPGFPISYPV